MSSLTPINAVRSHTVSHGCSGVVRTTTSPNGLDLVQQKGRRSFLVEHLGERGDDQITTASITYLRSQSQAGIEEGPVVMGSVQGKQNPSKKAKKKSSNSGQQTIQSLLKVTKASKQHRKMPRHRETSKLQLETGSDDYHEHRHQETSARGASSGHTVAIVAPMTTLTAMKNQPFHGFTAYDTRLQHEEVEEDPIAYANSSGPVLSSPLLQPPTVINMNTHARSPIHPTEKHSIEKDHATVGQEMDVDNFSDDEGLFDDDMVPLILSTSETTHQKPTQVEEDVPSPKFHLSPIDYADDVFESTLR